MTTLRELAVFGLICLASYLVGKAFHRVKLPSITGYLFAGALAGPFILDMLPADAPARLRFVDEISLAVIAFVAGGELLIAQLRPRFRGIGLTGAGILVMGYLILAISIYLMAPFISFTSGFDAGGRLALALLGAAVLLALSPPSTIAVIKDVHARGRFTRTILGVTVLMDVAVIVLFAVMTSIASPLLGDTSLDLGFVGVLAVDLASAALLGLVAGQAILVVLSSPFGFVAKAILILALGFGIYELADFVREASPGALGFEVYIEPLLISLIAGLYVVNYTRHRSEFEDLLHRLSPIVYVAFFTITGLSLKLDLLAAVLPFAVGLFLVRGLGILAGTWVGTTLAREPTKFRRLSWMAYITQAGIALGLAREVAIQFPALGDAFATLIISVVVINEIVGPLFLKSALRRAGEAHEPGVPGADEDGRVLVFGHDSQAFALAGALRAEGRDVTSVVLRSELERARGDDGEAMEVVDSAAGADIEEVFTEGVGAVVAMLEDDEANAAVIAHASERHGIDKLVVRATSALETARFDAAKALVIDPSTALVSLLAQSVSAPNAATLLLHQDEEREVIQVKVTNPDLDGLRVSEVALPPGVLLVELVRGDSHLLVNGQTRLRLGDDATLVLSEDLEQEVELMLR